MSPSSDFASKFVDLGSLIDTPKDYHKLMETLSILPQMKAIAANGDAIAQYKLAQFYVKNSNPYLHWMQASAEQGFTNAMLELSRALAENSSPANLQRAGGYLIKILKSDDSFIKAEANGLIARNQLLEKEIKRQLSTAKIGNSAIGFFAVESKTELKSADPAIETKPNV